MDSVVKIWSIAADAAQFCANTLTIILGCIALIALLRRREQIKTFFGLLQQVHLSHRTMQVRYTLREIERVNYDTKQDKPQVRALLGQLCGQLASLKDTLPALSNVYNKLLAFREKPNSITEFKKCEIVHELHGLLDNAIYSQTQSIAEAVNHESK